MYFHFKKIFKTLVCELQVKLVFLLCSSSTTPYFFKFFLKLEYVFLKFFSCYICQHTFDMWSVRDMFGKDMVCTMFWEFPTKIISIFLPSTFQLRSRIVSSKYMHDVSNVNTIVLYDLVILSHSTILLSCISRC